MARLARIVIPGVPHHVTQRGNGREQTFFSHDDYAFYHSLLESQCARSDVSVLGWCLMPNHVHLVLRPSDPDGLRRALAPLHRRYAGRIHAREKRTGHFWQGRFGCVAMDEAHTVAALAYVALNPVRAQLVAKTTDWKWSCIHGFEAGLEADTLLDHSFLAQFLPTVRSLIKAGEEDERFAALRKAETIGRPIGDEAFLEDAETKLGKSVRPRKRGRKPKLYNK